MQRYFFDLAEGAYPLDLQGIEFANIADARTEAARFAAEVLNTRPELASASGEICVEVTGSSRELLFTVIGGGLTSRTINNTLLRPF